LCGEWWWWPLSYLDQPPLPLSLSLAGRSGAITHQALVQTAPGPSDRESAQVHQPERVGSVRDESLARLRVFPAGLRPRPHHQTLSGIGAGVAPVILCHILATLTTSSPHRLHLLARAHSLQ